MEDGALRHDILLVETYMKIAELIETIRGKEKKHPYILALEGMIGSGKSYEA